MRLKPKAIIMLETHLWRLGHNPSDAAAGWRSRNPLVVATHFAALGYPVFPCTKLKTPLIQNGVHGATCDLKTMYYWDRDKPLAGWCVKTGRYEGGGPQGLWIYDKDDAAGYARWAELVSELGPPPPTWTLMSGREGGGEHVYYAPFQDGPDMKTVRHALINGKRGKIDQKGRGGYAVIAGSLHKTGNRYQWAEGCAPDEIPLASLPPRWVEAMDKADEKPIRDQVPRVRRSRTEYSGRGLQGNDVLGDGPDGGGFHGPINVICIRYFQQAGPDASGEKLLPVLQRMIEAAPKGQGRDVSRYLSVTYLMDAIESGRTFVKGLNNA